MRTFLLVAFAVAALVVVPAAAASRTVRLEILHYVSGCHIWSSSRKADARLVVKPGTRLEIRASCPMDFDVRQVSGPKLALGDPRMHAGTTRTIVFRTRGVYKLAAQNVQSSEQQGLQTLGADNALTLTVVVR